MPASTQVPPSRILIDWMSFSIPVKVQENKGSEIFGLHGQMMSMMHAALAQLPDALRLSLALRAVNPRAPFHYAFQCGDTSIRLSTSTVIDYVHIEFSGSGCEHLRSLGLEDVILSQWGHKLSRLDLAVDVECPLDPRVVSSQCENKRIKNRSEFESDTGITCYLGSTTSDRYCRVYRYRPPHERAHLLRLEFVHRDKVARELAKTILRYGRITCARIALESLKCTNKVISDLTNGLERSGEISGYMPERRTSNTVEWIKSQVVPALVRLEEDGEIEDSLEFIKNLVLHYKQTKA